MTITLAAGFPTSNDDTTNPTTLAITTVNAGDIIVAGVLLTPQTVSTTSITDTNSRITWQPSAVHRFVDAVNGGSYEIWYGVVKSSGGVGATTVDFNLSTSTPFTEAWAVELHSSVAGSVWSAVTSGHHGPDASTTITFPPLTSGPGASQAYVGYAGITGPDTDNATSGFTIFDTVAGSEIIYNLALAPSTLYSPTTTQGGTGSDAVGAIFLAAPPVSSLPIPFNPSWLILHQQGFEAVFQQPTPLTNTSINASPTAGVAAVTVAGLDATPVSVVAFPGVANVTVAANNPTAALTASPGAANVTVAGLDATPAKVTALPGTANVTVAANNPTAALTAPPGAANVTVAANTHTPALTALPGVANVTVAALDATAVTSQGSPVLGGPAPWPFILAQFGFTFPQPITSLVANATPTAGVAGVTVAGLDATPVNVTALPGAANVTVAANNPTAVSVVAFPAVANVTVAANNPTAALTTLPGVAAVTVAGLDATPVSVVAFPGVANVTVAAFNPSVTAGGNATANPGVANVTVAANTHTPLVTGFPSAANVTVAANTASPSLTAPPPAANVTVAALNPTAVSVVAFPGVANVTVAALNPSVSIGGNITANAGLASVTVAALNPAPQVSPTMAAATVIAAALIAKSLVTVNTGAANSVVAATNVSFFTPPTLPGLVKPFSKGGVVTPAEKGGTDVG